MEIKSSIEEKVDSTMNLLENFTQVAPNPYLYTKIISGIKRSNKVFYVFSLKPVLLMLLVFLNLISAAIFLWLMISKPANDLKSSTYMTEELYSDEAVYYEIK
ncbi:MAG: hypothetical protein ACP5P3_02875 [Ignavibacteria bacterium]